MQITRHFSEKEIEGLIKKAIIDELRSKNKLDALLKSSDDIAVYFHNYYDRPSADDGDSAIATITIEI